MSDATWLASQIYLGGVSTIDNMPLNNAYITTFFLTALKLLFVIYLVIFERAVS